MAGKLQGNSGELMGSAEAPMPTMGVWGFGPSVVHGKKDPGQWVNRVSF